MLRIFWNIFLHFIFLMWPFFLYRDVLSECNVIPVLSSEWLTYITLFCSRAFFPLLRMNTTFSGQYFTLLCVKTMTVLILVTFDTKNLTLKSRKITAKLFTHKRFLPFCKTVFYQGITLFASNCLPIVEIS